MFEFYFQVIDIVMKPFLQFMNLMQATVAFIVNQ